MYLLVITGSVPQLRKLDLRDNLIADAKELTHLAGCKVGDLQQAHIFLVLDLLLDLLNGVRRLHVQVDEGGVSILIDAKNTVQ